MPTLSIRTAAQVVHDVAPALRLYFPAAQSTQLAAPAALEVPARQGVQEAVDQSYQEPAAQLTHAERDVLPVASVYLPVGHSVGYNELAGQ